MIGIVFASFFHFISIETTKNDDLVMKYSLLTHFFYEFFILKTLGSINFEFFKKLTIFKPLWSSLIKDPPLSLGESYGVAF